MVLDYRPSAVAVVEGCLVVMDVEDRLVVVVVVDGGLVVVVDVDDRLIVVVVNVRLPASSVVVVTDGLGEDTCLMIRSDAAPRLLLVFSVTVAVSVTVGRTVSVSTSNSAVVTVATTLDTVETVMGTALPIIVHGVAGTVTVA
jgi:hypothetical protein